MTPRKRRAAPAPDGLKDEIEVLRDLLRRAIEASIEHEPGAPPEELAFLLKALDSLSRSAGRLGRLLEIQRRLEQQGGLGEPLLAAMERAVQALSSPSDSGGKDG